MLHENVKARKHYLSLFDHFDDNCKAYMDLVCKRKLTSLVAHETWGMPRIFFRFSQSINMKSCIEAVLHFKTSILTVQPRKQFQR